MAIEIERYMAAGHVTGATIPTQESDYVLALIMGYVPDWNWAVDTDFGRVTRKLRDYEHSRKQVLRIRQVMFRGGDKNGNFSIKWGKTADDPTQVGVVVTATANIVDLNNPVGEAPFALLHAVHIHENDFDFGRGYYHTWNGIFESSDFDIAIGSRQTLVFIFSTLTNLDRLYFYTIFERQLEKD